jgi:hypothetical protein
MRFHKVKETSDRYGVRIHPILWNAESCESCEKKKASQIARGIIATRLRSVQRRKNAGERRKSIRAKSMRTIVSRKKK